MVRLRRFHVAIWLLAGLLIAPAVSRAQDPRLLPANTEIVFTINVKQMLNSELAKGNKDNLAALKAMLDNIPIAPFDEIVAGLKEIGFDPFTHLHSLTIAHSGDQNSKDGLAVIDGMFDAGKFAKLVKKYADDNPDDVKIAKFGTNLIYTVKTPGESLCFSLLGGKSLVVAADEDVLKGAITRSTGKEIVAVKVKDLLKGINDKQSFSFVSTGASVLNVAKLIVPNLPDAVESIQGIVASVTITKDIDLKVGINTKDEQSAKDLVTLGQGGLLVVNQLAAAAADANAAFVPVVDILKTLRLTSTGSNVQFSGNVSMKNLQLLIESLQGLFDDDDGGSLR